MTPERRRELDEADLRWFWIAAESELGFVGGGDFERAAQAQTAPVPRCPECQIEQVRLCARLSELPTLRRMKRAKCRACLGLGVVVPTTYPRGTAPAAAAEESVWMRFMRTDDAAPILSAREPAWMGLVGPAAHARRRHRAVRLTLAAMETGHVLVLHAVYGPACRVFPPEMPLSALILAAMNRALPEQVRVPLRKRIRAASNGNVDPFDSPTNPARRHVGMLLSGSWRAWDRARGRVVEEERVAFVEDMAAIDAVVRRPLSRADRREVARIEREVEAVVDEYAGLPL